MKLSHVRLLASNIHECFLFYRDVIGLEVRYGDETTPFAEFATGDVSFALETPMAEDPVEARSASMPFSGRDQVALVFRVGDIDAVYEKLQSKGVTFVQPPRDTPEWGHRVAYLRDPAGNILELNQGI
ncbi:VOC family protein [Cohnella sp. GCM10012308]|uniref:VOC family protein n=1 Tax=Cohnella sp. GCM10012308 TaxID=3317329 RepID=UPI0036170AF9